MDYLHGMDGEGVDKRGTGNGVVEMEREGTSLRPSFLCNSDS